MNHRLNLEDFKLINILKGPSLYQVLVLNDGFSPMEFVVEVLEKIFCMDRACAVEVMFKAHLEGQAECGIFSKDLAETKIALVDELAARHEYPLTCSMEVAN